MNYYYLKLICLFPIISSCLEPLLLFHPLNHHPHLPRSYYQNPLLDCYRMNPLPHHLLPPLHPLQKHLHHYQDRMQFIFWTPYSCCPFASSVSPASPLRSAYPSPFDMLQDRSSRAHLIPILSQSANLPSPTMWQSSSSGQEYSSSESSLLGFTFL